MASAARRLRSGVRAAYPDATITVIANTADDITLHGLRICPDLDTMMYTLGGGADQIAAGAVRTRAGR